LLDPIKIPNNLNLLKDKLPKSNYDLDTPDGAK